MLELPAVTFEYRLPTKVPSLAQSGSCWLHRLCCCRFGSLSLSNVTLFAHVLQQNELAAHTCRHGLLPNSASDIGVDNSPAWYALYFRLLKNPLAHAIYAIPALLPYLEWGSYTVYPWQGSPSLMACTRHGERQLCNCYDLSCRRIPAIAHQTSDRSCGLACCDTCMQAALHNCSFYSNSAGSSGGGVYLAGHSCATIR
jgi:hypothetical protein